MPWPTAFETQTDADFARPRTDREKLVLAATFTAEPLEEALRFWMRELAMPMDIYFAPYNQIFQQLLDPTSLLATNGCGLNVLLIRLEDLGRSLNQRQSEPSEACAPIEQNARELLFNLKPAAARSNVPWLVCLCPISRAALAGTPHEFWARLEKQFADELAASSSLHLITPRELLSLYPTPEYDDPQANRLGHVPYTPSLYAALGTLIARRAHAWRRPAKKVIALDCDQTLWGGICGEDGAWGVQLDEPRLALQRFMRQQHDAGMLLCLCSKNNETDVAEVFRCRPEMPLRPEHFVARRVNWRPKSENLRSLAQELRLGLDSFILVDDNSVECAEVEANCSEVTAIRLPENPAELQRFLEHVWTFDHLKVTDEDRERTARYRQNQLREQSEAAAPSLRDFLAGLNLQIQIEPARAEQLARVSQLTQRTNQFNCTTIRRSEEEIRALHREAASRILTVTVSDRFGDYGLVGAIIYRTDGEALAVDTFLLSCRVLGKGVEHRILARLGQFAQELGLRTVNVLFRSTSKNQPALDFLERVGADFRQRLVEDDTFVFPAAAAATVAFEPEANKVSQGSTKPALPMPAEPPSDAGVPAKMPTARYEWIARNARDAEQISHLIEAQVSARPASQATAHVPPRTETQRQFCEAWRQVLRLERVGIQDDFFALGGTSQLAVRLCAKLEKLTGRKLALVTLFKAPTVEQLAHVLEAKE